MTFYCVVRAMARVHLFLRHVKSCHRVRTGHEKQESHEILEFHFPGLESHDV